MGHQLMEAVASFFGGLGYAEIFFLMALESSVFPVPSEAVMIPAGYLAAQGKLDPFLAVLTGGLGSVVGALANYWILGRWLGRPFLEKYGRWILVTPQKFARAETLFLRGANWATFVGRFIPVVRHLISIPAGLFKMRTVPFLALTFVGATLWCAVLAAAGWFLGERAVALFAQFAHLGGMAVAALVAVPALMWLAARIRARWGWKGSAVLRVGLLALLYPAGFWLVPKLEMQAAFPRQGYQPMDLPAQHVFLTGAEGNRISAAWSPAGPRGGTVVLYLHGNGGPLPMWREEMDFFNAQGFSFFAPDYPGYGESTGTPTEAGVYDMAEKSFAWLTGEGKVAASHIVIVGFSIGTGPAAELALRHPEAGGLVLLAPYVSLQSMARAAYGAAPQRWWSLPDVFATAAKVPRVVLPTIVVHGDADRVIPFSQGEEVFRASGAPDKRFVRLAGEGHVGAYRAGEALSAAWTAVFGKK